MKKALISILSLVLIISNFYFLTPNASAATNGESFSHTTDKEKIEIVDLDKPKPQLPTGPLVEESGETGIQPFATVIEMDKPIAYVGYLSNYKLGQMADRYDRNVTWLNIVNALLFATGAAAPAGVVNSVVSAFASSPSKVREAYLKGQHAYVVSVYASGVKPSLSKITYIYYTTKTLTFR